MAIHGRPAAEQRGLTLDSSMPMTLISCLCVTRGRVALLGRAVGCFLEQTHAQRELLILFESDDAATRDYVATPSTTSHSRHRGAGLAQANAGIASQPCRRRGSRALRMPVG